MSEQRNSRLILRRIAAVLAGLLAVVILSTATDAVLHATGVFPLSGQPMSDALFLLATIYRTIYGIVGGYIAARLAPDRPMAHALALGGVGVAISLAGAAATWNAEAAFGPRWYPLALIVMAMLSAWVGGKLRGEQLPARTNASVY